MIPGITGKTVQLVDYHRFDVALFAAVFEHFFELCAVGCLGGFALFNKYLGDLVSLSFAIVQTRGLLTRKAGAALCLLLGRYASVDNGFVCHR
jgi:hypothetical protein